MRKIYIILSLIGTIGCGDFLDEIDQDKVVPEKTDHYSALLLKEFNQEYPIFRTVDHMTDNVVENPRTFGSKRFPLKTTYTWQREIEIDEDGNSVNSNTSWEKIYEDVAICNYVIELIEDATGDPEEIAYVKGEAHFIRALSYFNLLNLYGQPFDADMSGSQLGVPIRDNIGVELTYHRNTVMDCYAFIEADLTKATKLIEGSGVQKSLWHPGVPACNLLMSRVKLYQQKWNDAITYADKVIDAAGLSKMALNGAFITEGSPEVLYSYYSINPVFDNDETSFPYLANPELVNLYDEADLRKEVFFSTIRQGTSEIYITKKYQSDYSELGWANMRVSEAYLNRAEAYAQTGDVGNAKADLQALHAMRYSDVSKIVYPTDAQQMLSFVLADRRKELCFEDHHRWFDLRRMANRPQIKHDYTLVDETGATLGIQVYTLLSKDPNYTLPIPLKERQNNPYIENNDRYEKFAQ